MRDMFEDVVPIRNGGAITLTAFENDAGKRERLHVKIACGAVESYVDLSPRQAKALAALLADAIKYMDERPVAA